MVYLFYAFILVNPQQTENTRIFALDDTSAMINRF
jgi:hypothetical protein